MTLFFHSVPSPDSALRRSTARWKLPAFAVLGIAIACLRTSGPAAAGLAISCLILKLAQVPLGWSLRRLAALAPFLLLFAGLAPLSLDRDAPGWDLGPLRLTRSGIDLSILLTLKTVALLNLTLAYVCSTPVGDTWKAAHHLRLPGFLIHLLALSHRYVFLFSEELARLRVALRVRGFRNRMNAHSYRTAGHVLGTLFVRGYERGERVAHAMRCRGFDGRYRALAESRARPGEAFFFLGAALASVALLLLDFHLR